MHVRGGETLPLVKLLTSLPSCQGIWAYTSGCLATVKTFYMLYVIHQAPGNKMAGGN